MALRTATRSLPSCRHAPVVVAVLAAGLLSRSAAADTWTSVVAGVPTVDAQTVVLPVPVDGDFTVLDVNVIVYASHASPQQLRGTLVHPDGSEVLLFDRPDGTELISTCFDDEAPGGLSGPAPWAGSFLPVGDLSALEGKPALGQWQLRVHDRAGEGTGTVRGVALAFNGRTYVCPVTHQPLQDLTTTLLPLTVPDAFTVGDVDVIPAWDHALSADITVDLQAHGLIHRVLSIYNSSFWFHHEMGPLALDDESPVNYPKSGGGSLQVGRYAPGHPEELGVWTGLPAQGDWTLRIHDNQLDDAGDALGWALHLTEAPVCDKATWSLTELGVPGSSGLWPTLDLASAPVLDTTVDLVLGNAAGAQTPALLMLGLEPGILPGLGGTLWLAPLVELPLLLPPQGLVLPVLFSSSALPCGVPILAQLLHADAAAPQGVAFSRRLHVLPGSF